MTDNPILVNRMGGLGNQLFQYAAARAVAFYHPGSKIYVEPETYNIHNHKKYDYASFFMKHAHRMIEHTFDNNNLVEFNQGNSFYPWSPHAVHPPVKLCGYFQYYPALLTIMPDLVSEFNQALRPFLSLMMMENGHKCMFMHVRRGDYLALPQYHYVQSKTYYENAFAQWRLTFSGNDFKVFLISDDSDWCRQQEWSFPYEIYENEDEMETLAFMSQCKAGAIIGNSSYSYWGAILSGNKHVFYPEKWIAEKVYDLFPSHWVCVSG